MFPVTSLAYNLVIRNGAKVFDDLSCSGSNMNDHALIANNNGDDNDNAANNRFNKQKQSRSACALHFGTFLYRPLQNNNAK